MPSCAFAQPLPSCDQRYAIDAELDPATHVVSGQESVTFRNHSDKPLAALYFHLYPNAFRDKGTVFMREAGTRLRGSKLVHPGSLRVLRMRTRDGADLLARADDALIPGDATQLRVPLPAPLAPGADLTLDIGFRTELPAIVARSGYAGSFHMLGQWFPKLARLESSGEFASFPYHGLGEFYADFADYDVRIRAPERYRVAASGSLVTSAREAGVRTMRYRAHRVHDFALALYPHFISKRVQVGRVSLALFAPLGYAAALERQRAVLSQALPYFERRYGSYPYPELSVVIPPKHAHAAAGMEYPTLFTSGGRSWALPGWAPDPEHDALAVHELAHQWFSGMLASNEVAYPALDEGLAEWASLDFLRRYYASGTRGWTRGLGVGIFDVLQALFSWRGPTPPSSLLPAASYRYETLARAVYMRPALVFEAIAARYGRKRLEAAFARYARAQRFEHPTPPDLYAAFDASFGPGFAQRVLEPALQGKPVVELGARATTTAERVDGRSFLTEMMLVAQALLQWLGA